MILKKYPHDPKPINSPNVLGLPNIICINDVKSDGLAYGKKAHVLNSLIFKGYLGLVGAVFSFMKRTPGEFYKMSGTPRNVTTSP
ncbi:MAG: hypothetical protein WBV95_09035 [Desulfobacterales bacterium]